MFFDFYFQDQKLPYLFVLELQQGWTRKQEKLFQSNHFAIAFIFNNINLTNCYFACNTVQYKTESNTEQNPISAIEWCH